MPVQRQAVESALDLLRPSLAPDGFDLKVGDLEPGGAVQVILEAKPEACLDCLVPEEMIVQMLEDAIRRQDASLTSVALVKEGFENRP